MPDPTGSATFTVGELWALHASVRHDMAGREQWSEPPFSRELNDKLADALIRCEDLKLAETPIELTRRECMVIDHNVGQHVKDRAGNLVGPAILMKAFRVRRELDEHDALRNIFHAAEPMPTAQEQPDIDVEGLMAEFKASYKPPRATRRRKGT